MTELLLIGASGLAREVLACVRESGQFDVVGILDDDESKVGSALDGAPDPGSRQPRPPLPGGARGRLHRCGEGARTGRRQTRRARVSRATASRRWSTLRCGFPYCCDIGPGSILLGNVTLTAGITVGSHVVMMPGVTLTHDDVVEDFATLAAGVSLGGGVRIGRAAYLGMNSCVRERTRVGAGTQGRHGSRRPGATFPTGETWAGVPARVLEPAAAAAGGVR